MWTNHTQSLEFSGLLHKVKRISEVCIFIAISNDGNSESESTDSAHSISATWPFYRAVSYDVLLAGCVNFSDKFLSGGRARKEEATGVCSRGFAGFFVKCCPLPL